MVKSREEFYKDIDVFSKGVSGFSPFIIDIMRGIEREYGGVEEEFINRISEKFEVTSKEVLDTCKMLGIKIIVKKEPKEVRVCSGMTCKTNGGDFLLEEFKKQLKIDEDEITKDGSFVLRTQRCFGMCAQGANVKVRDKFYHGVMVSDVKTIIEENR